MRNVGARIFPNIPFDKLGFEPKKSFEIFVARANIICAKIIKYQ